MEGYIAALRKGKKKMPRCKLVILGDAGVGKTNLLNLLTGEGFVPTHEKTEGVEISLVSTSDIDTKTWKKSKEGPGHDEYRKIATLELANQLKHTKPDNKTDASPTPESLYQMFNDMMRKYAEPVRPKPKRPTSTSYQESFSSSKSSGHRDNHVQHKKVRSADEHPAEFEQRAQVRSTLKKELQPIHTRSDTTATVTAVSSPPPSSSHSIQEMDTSTSEQQPSASTDIPSSGDQFYTVILRDASKQKSSEPLTLHLKLTSLDFAGQEHYRSMHPCFLTFRAVYIVTFNARKLVQGAEHKCQLEEINYWLNSILVHTNTDPKVILVGTHRGPYYGPNGFDILTDEQQRCIDERLKKHLKNLSVFTFFKGDKIMALVESSIQNDEEASGAKVVREKLRSLGDNHPGNKDDLPISYLRLESKIFEERSKSKLLLIPYDEVEQWARDFGIEDINVALDFFHDIGIIINPSKLM